MLTKVSPSIRSNVLLAVTALVVAFVRSFLQYHRYFWENVGQFLASWLIHYVAVFIVVGISYHLICTKARFFLDREKEIAVDEAIVYVSIVLLVVAVFIFFVAHWTPDEMYE